MAINAGPTAKLCHWACSMQYEDLPTEVRKVAVNVLYDQIGCMIASATLPTCQPVVDLMRKLGPAGECTIIGHPVRTSATNAALANGTIGHGDEVDSYGPHGTGHYAATQVPTALTIGQYVGASGKEMCRALALGSEVAVRTQGILQCYGTRKQFHTGIGGTLGAAVNAGLLLRLNAEQMEYALGLAASGTCGLYSAHQEELHQTKSLNHGKAVEAGVLAALLAQVGYQGPREVFTVEDGFFDAFTGVPSAGHEMMEKLGDDYIMAQIFYKRYPVGVPNQTPLHAFLQLIKKQKLKADDIEEIEVSVSRHGFTTVSTNKHPSVHMETILWLAAVYGEITFSHIHDPRYLADPRVKAFRDRVRILIIPRFGAGGERIDTGIKVRTRNGETLREAPGFPLMSQADIQQKFRDLAGLRLDSERVTDLERKVMAIEAQQNVASLIGELELPY